MPLPSSFLSVRTTVLISEPVVRADGDQHDARHDAERGLQLGDSHHNRSVRNRNLLNAAAQHNINLILEGPIPDYGWAERLYLEGYPTCFSTVNGTHSSLLPDPNSDQPQNDPYKETHVTITVYDVLGRKVETLVDGNETAGIHEVTFNGSRLASGVYFYRLATPSYLKVTKMLELK